MSSMISIQGSSGLDITSLVSSLTQQKRATYNSRTSAKRYSIETSISGVGQLKSNLSSLKDTLSKTIAKKDTLTSETSQSNLSQYSLKRTNEGLNPQNPQPFDIEISDNKEVQAQQFEFEIKQLAKQEKISRRLEDRTFNAGTLTFSLGMGDDGNAIRFEVDVQSGDNLKAIQKKISDNDFGVQGSIISTGAVEAGLGGYIFSIQGGKTGDNATELRIEASTEELREAFGFSQDENNGWNHERAQDAVAEYNSEEIRSRTNTFENIPGITINAKSEGSDSITVSKDNKQVASNVKETIEALNSMFDNINNLTKYNTYTDGKNNYDGGKLAGNSEVKSISNVLRGTVTASMFEKDDNGNTLNSLGISIDKSGKVTFDENKFLKTIEKDPNAIDLLNSENGLFSKLNNRVSEFLDTGVQSMTDSYNKELKYIEKQEERYDEIVSKYSETLMKRYTHMESLISGYNANLSYVNSILQSLGTN